MNLTKFMIYIVSLAIVYSAHAKKIPKQNIKNEDLVEELTNSDVEEKLKELNSKSSTTNAADPKDEKKQRDEIKKLEKDAFEFSRKADLAKEGFGEFSEERSTMLHSLGRAVYRLGRFEEALGHSKEIIRIHENLYGIDHKKTADALGNLASVSFRLKDMETCTKAMMRALSILLKINKNDEGNKDILMHRAKMLTFGIKEGESSKGISYEEYSGNNDKKEKEL